MVAKKITISFLVLVYISLVPNITFGASSEPSESEKKEYKQDMTRIEDFRKSFKPGLVNDLKEYEKFADAIQKKWSRQNKEYYARLMLEVCGPPSSGTFADDRRYDVARRYALSVLEKSEEISIEMELKLTGHVVTLMYTPNSPKGEDFAQRRKKDVEIRLHAWKRLFDTIDPNWDPNEELRSPNAVATSMGFPGTIAPEAIKDPKLRAEYEAAMQKNREDIERYTKQYRLRDWLKSYPKSRERDIVLMYSEPPFNLEELNQYLETYIADEKTRSRIVDAVKENMEKHTDKTPKDAGVH
jgi:hypothetical protein